MPRDLSSKPITVYEDTKVEAAQDDALKLLEQGGNGRPLSHQLLGCRAIDKRRRMLRELRLAQGFQFTRPSAGVDHVVELERQELLRTVLDLLDQLKPPIRARVIRLFFFEDLSHRQIAQTLQIPVGTSQSHLFLGVRALRSALKEADIFTLLQELF